MFTQSTDRLPGLDTGAAESLGLIRTVPTPGKHMLLFASINVISHENFSWSAVTGSCPLGPDEDPVPAARHQGTEPQKV